MVAWNEADELRRDALGKEIALHRFQDREQKVRRDFWAKVRRVAGQVPFVEDLVAAYYCALDPTTAMRVRGVLLAALAYFILPFDSHSRHDAWTWLHRRRSRANCRVGLRLRAYYSRPSRSSGKSARQGAAEERVSLQRLLHLPSMDYLATQIPAFIQANPGLATFVIGLTTVDLHLSSARDRHTSRPRSGATTPLQALHQAHRGWRSLDKGQYRHRALPACGPVDQVRAFPAPQFAVRSALPSCPNFHSTPMARPLKGTTTPSPGNPAQALEAPA